MRTFVVKCRDYQSSSRKTREAAEKLKESIEALAVCPHPHEIVEVDGTRVTPTLQR